MKTCGNGHSFEGNRCIECKRKAARERWYRLGVSHPRKAALERFELNVSPEPNTGCWLWTGALSVAGYAKLRHGFDKSDLAHRFAYQQFRGPIPDGLVLDHLCRNTWCVNPVHLEAVTERINLIRGVSPVGINHRKTHCLRGHELAGTNLYMTNRGQRYCKECIRIRSRKYKSELRA
jgi:hypothetical protein